MLKSLIWKNKQIDPVINPKNTAVLTEDLNLKKIMSIMSREPIIKMTSETFLNAVTSDAENILYRQCILQDFVTRNDIMTTLEEIVVALDEMQKLHKILKPELMVPKLMLRLRKLELYLSIMKKLELIFDVENPLEVSEEFTAIGDEIKKNNQKIGLSNLFEDIKEIKEISSKFKSIDIGINIDYQYEAREAIIININDFKYKKSNLIEKISCGDNDKKNKISIASEIDIRNAGQKLSFQYELYKEIEVLLSKELIKIENIQSKYSDLVTSGILVYRDEICLYYGALRLFEFMRSRKYKSCFPRISPEDINIKGIYSLVMAYESISADDENKFKVVENDLNMSSSEKTILITGANDGGKTVMLESLGAVQLLFQNGIMIPAFYAELPIYNKIYSHFPKDEDLSIGAGRLGEEAERVSGILKEAKDSVLVLFNEPYITTSPTEGLDILVLSIKRFLEKGATVFLVTHYLDFLSEIKENEKIASYVMEITDGLRTYKAIRHAPMSESHALDVAKAHGVDAEGMIKLIRSRKINSDSEELV
ncbi:MAG: hypothetical protein KAH14_10980 [Clostridiales bacterium]|nr:hypothetical protein [Clostridiales bacterium]